MTRAKRPLLSLIVTAIGLAVVGVIIYFVPPNSTWIEVGVLLLIALTSFLGASWLLGNIKRGVQVTLALLGLLILQRFGFLNLLTLGIWVLVIGLLSLVN